MRNFLLMSVFPVARVRSSQIRLFCATRLSFWSATVLSFPFHFHPTPARSFHIDTGRFSSSFPMRIVEPSLITYCAMFRYDALILFYASIAINRVSCHGIVSGVVAGGMYYEGYSPSFQYKQTPPIGIWRQP